MTLKTTLALATVLIMAPIVAHADPIAGWYGAAGAGVNFTPDAKAKDGHFGDPTVNFSQPGWNIQGSGGYSFANGIRVEEEIWHSRIDVQGINTSPTHNGHLSNLDFFTNALYDFKTGTNWTPYAGVGIGLSLVDVNKIGPMAAGGYLSETAPEFGYQGIVGTAYQIAPHWALTADYRYVASTGADVHRTDPSGYGKIANQSHNAVFGVRYNFGSPPPVPPMQTAAAPIVAAPAVMKPAPAPMAQSYMVFFDFNKSDLTPEAKRIVASAAEDYKHGGFLHIVVTGHTDTKGSVPYNLQLSQRRAAAVKAELERLGVKGDAVVAKGVGKDGLMVPTADQVREAQNRRAEIVFEQK